MYFISKVKGNSPSVTSSNFRLSFSGKGSPLGFALTGLESSFRTPRHIPLGKALK